VSLVCWIMVLIKMFPAEGVLKGVLAILCGLYAFIWGWMNAGRFGLKNIMLIWTVAIIISVIANMMSGGMAMMQNLPQ
ncbi:MAG TPA: hypothetical protein VF414_07160, partial [Thermoanaerobaculia bacterium]